MVDLPIIINPRRIPITNQFNIIPVCSLDMCCNTASRPIYIITSDNLKLQNIYRLTYSGLDILERVTSEATFVCHDAFYGLLARLVSFNVNSFMLNISPMACFFSRPKFQLGFNPLIATLFHFNFHPLQVGSR